MSAGLDALLLACLDEDPLRRPPAASLVVALRHTAEKTEALAPILPTPPAAKTDKASQPGPPRRRRFPALALALGAAGSWALVALVVLGVQAIRARDWGGLELRGRSTVETPDAGVGDEALASMEGARVSLPPLLSLGRPMPTKPQPGQRKPPCEPRVEREIHGACWIGPLKEQESPCGDRMYDYEGECYLASYPAPRQPASEEPR